jgi:hypothetical protein
MSPDLIPCSNLYSHFADWFSAIDGVEKLFICVETCPIRMTVCALRRIFLTIPKEACRNWISVTIRREFCQWLSFIAEILFFLASIVKEQG